MVAIVCNFTPPTKLTPSLLTLDEVQTLFHEFGHGLHALFADVKYRSLGRVEGDFVELPSQIMENWATEKEFLDLWAVNYKTGEPIPADLIAKIVAAENYQAAYFNVRQLLYGLNDMAWHSIDKPFEGDVELFERTAMAPAQVLPVVEGAAMSPAFSHIFAGGYAAGYYGYKWAEVLAADALLAVQGEGYFQSRSGGGFPPRNSLEGRSRTSDDALCEFPGTQARNQGSDRKDGARKIELLSAWVSHPENRKGCLQRQPFSCECIEDRDDRRTDVACRAKLRAGKSSYSDNKNHPCYHCTGGLYLDRWRDQNSEVK